jgi:hypothetical protein
MLRYVTRKHCRNFWDSHPKYINENYLLFWPPTVPAREFTSAYFPYLCSCVCVGHNANKPFECVRFWTTSSFLELRKHRVATASCGLIMSVLGVTKLMQRLRAAESEVSSVMCRFVTEELTSQRRQWYQVQRFPNLVARGPLLASDNSYWSSYSSHVNTECPDDRYPKWKLEVFGTVGNFHS